MPVMKTPGVYIVEQSAFPNSIVEVATAVPAFIGYTERADNKGKTLKNTPWRISSLAEYHQYFGMAPTAKFVINERPSLSKAELAAAKVKADATAAAAKAALVASRALDVGVAQKEQALAEALSGQADANLELAKAEWDLDSKPDDAPTVTAKDDALAAKSATDIKVTAAQSELATAIGEAETAAEKVRANAIIAQAKAEESDKKHRAVTQAKAMQKLALAVKAQAIAASTLATADAALAKNKSNDDLQKAQLKAAADKKTTDDAVTAEQSSLTEALEPTPLIDTDTVVPSGPTAFKLGDKEYLLTQRPDAAGGRFLLYYGMRQFFQNGGGPCYIVSVGGYNAGGVEAGKLADGIDLLIKEQEPTMLVLPDCMLLKVDDCISVQQKALMHCGNVMRNRVAILDIWGGDRAINEGPIAEFRDKLGINCLDFAAAYYPWVNTTVVQDNELSYANIDNLAKLQSLLRLELKLPMGSNTANASPKDKALLKTVADITNTPAVWAAASAAAGGDNKPKSEQEQAADARMQSQLLNKSLLALSPMFNSVLGELKNQLNLLPPSAAMAGIYTMVDNTRGVWKAPANVSLNGVISPAVNLSAEDQEDLNVTTQGKSINAIRSFIGEGVLVWGARTLDGNSLDWRYISVRRTMIMLEESCRLAAKAMVFEPNVANTWVTIKSMIQNFLTGIWKRGGLAGAVPDDAFSVHVGLGETMSSEDILEGILRVTVLVAISRPAEFIEITFQQQMQKS